MTTFGASLKRHRVRAGLRQNELARRAGIDPTYVTRLEHQPELGPSRRVVLDLARVLGLGTIERDLFLIAAGHCPDVVLGMSERQFRAVYALLGDDRVEPARLGVAS